MILEIYEANVELKWDRIVLGLHKTRFYTMH